MLFRLQLLKFFLKKNIKYYDLKKINIQVCFDESSCPRKPQFEMKNAHLCMMIAYHRHVFKIQCMHCVIFV